MKLQDSHDTTLRFTIKLNSQENGDGKRTGTWINETEWEPRKRCRSTNLDNGTRTVQWREESPYQIVMKHDVQKREPRSIIHITYRNWSINTSQTSEKQEVIKIWKKTLEKICDLACGHGSQIDTTSKAGFTKDKNGYIRLLQNEKLLLRERYC
jgi:hypothetical protein